LKNFTVFLQGSYANDTNVYRESDVDIVIRPDDMFYFDIEAIGEPAQQSFRSAMNSATYGYAEFRAEVLAWLKKNYGNDVVNGTKAITIKAGGNRRQADVLPCTKFRRYLNGSTGKDENYVEGICFFRSDGVRIPNFPKQHSDNCTTKHQNTSKRFKPNVRVFKNLRNRMVDEKVIRDGLAPSYFIEGMLWNVPNSLFQARYDATFPDAVNWLRASDKDDLKCANEMYYLLRDGSAVCWNKKDFDEFLTAVVKYWNEWE